MCVPPQGAREQTAMKRGARAASYQGATASAVRSDLVVLGTTFKDTAGTVQGFLLIFPDPTMLDLVA